MDSHMHIMAGMNCDRIITYGHMLVFGRTTCINALWSTRSHSFNSI